MNRFTSKDLTPQAKYRILALANCQNLPEKSKKLYEVYSQIASNLALGYNFKQDDPNPPAKYNSLVSHALILACDILQGMDKANGILCHKDQQDSLLQGYTDNLNYWKNQGIESHKKEQANYEAWEKDNANNAPFNAQGVNHD